MADALLSSALGTSFLELPEIPRRSSKHFLSECPEGPSQPEKRRKALALPVGIKVAKSLKLAEPDSAVLSSEPVAKNCFSTSSGISLRHFVFFVLMCLHEGLLTTAVFPIL